MASDERHPEQPRAEKKWWESVPAKLGAISAAIGVLLAVAGLPREITTRLRGDPRENAELQKVRTEIELSKPRLDIRYVQLLDELRYQRESLESGTAGADSATSPVARTLLSLPVVQTGIASEPGQDELLSAELEETQIFRYTTYLLIENRGQRDATGIAMFGRQLELAAAVGVRESATGGDDYAALLRRQGRGDEPVVIRVPRTLAPGDAVLLPLFTNAHPATVHDRWWVTSPRAILPDSLLYVDAVLGQPTMLPVRAMVNATRVAPGVMDRG